MSLEEGEGQKPLEKKAPEELIDSEFIQILREQFGLMDVCNVQLAGSSGIVNETFFVDTANQKLVVQRLHNMFPAQSIADRIVVTDFLANKNWSVPRFISTNGGAKFATDSSGHLCTVYPYVPGITVSNVESLSEPQSFETGKLLRRFHDDLKGLQYSPSFKIEHFRDARYHIKHLESIRPKMGDDARSLSQRVLSASEELNYLESDQRQLIHGDPKIQNFLYEEDGMPFTIIDFDTIMLGSRFIDIGDLLRSLSTTDGGTREVVNNQLIDAALSGYWNGGNEVMDKQSFFQRAYAAQQLISLDLCSMFLIDIADDSYFKWDSSQYESRAAHNLARAQCQWKVYQKISLRP